MGRNSTWSSEQTAYLMANVEKLTDSQIAGFVKKTIHAVRKHRLRLGLKKANGRGICRLASSPAPIDKPEICDKVDILESKEVDSA